MSGTRRFVKPLSLLSVVLVLCGWLPAIAQANPVAPASSRPAAPAPGKQDFESRCAACHGLDGRGGERGPNISANPAVQQLADQELHRIVYEGLPSKGMPAFDYLTDGQIKSIVSYLRFLGGRAPDRSSKGNRLGGRVLFFGKAGCGNCHMMNGNGGFLGPDLVHYAGTHTPDELREIILNPGKSGGPHGKIIEIVTRTDGRLTGVLLNEDNFSVQLLGADGTLHMLMKSEVEQLNRGYTKLMPGDYGERLTGSEREDLVAYLTQGARRTAGESRRQTRRGVSEAAPADHSHQRGQLH